MATSRKMIESLFKYFIESIGGKMASSWNDVGGYAINYNANYGGYQIVRISNSSGGVSEPFGSARMKAGAFEDALRFGTRAIEEYKRNKKR